MRLLAIKLLLLLAPQASLLSISIACTNTARFGRSSSAEQQVAWHFSLVLNNSLSQIQKHSHSLEVPNIINN